MSEARFSGLLSLLLACGCGSDWRTDMWYQPSHRAEDSPRPEPAHSVALGSPVKLLDRDDAEDFHNPVPFNTASVGRGSALFVERCACCHGATGHGGGPVSRYFPPAPDLAYDAVKLRSDGYLFGTITLGGRAMPPQAEGLTLTERWDLVNLVRSIQGRTPASSR